MAHSKQAIKRIRTSEESRLRNKTVRSGVKNAIKKARRDGGDKGVAVSAEKAIDKAAQKGVIHKNAAARKKSRLARALNKAKAAGAK